VRRTVLRKQYTSPTSSSVTKAHPLRPRSAIVRTGLTLLGGLIILISPVIGVLPGPGGVFVFAAGLALMLQNSDMAKRVFVRLKRRWPKLGYVADLGLRRASALRRFERDRPLDKDGKKLSRIRVFGRTIMDFVRGRRG